MPRVKISEFRAKQILYPYLGEKYGGKHLTKGQDFKEILDSLDSAKTYVVKVDEGIKKRQKSGLLFTNIAKSEIKHKINELIHKIESEDKRVAEIVI